MKRWTFRQYVEAVKYYTEGKKQKKTKTGTPHVVDSVPVFMPYDPVIAAKEMWKARLGIGREGAFEDFRKAALINPAWQQGKK